MKLNAVIFDLDGTLLDTLEDLADSTNRVLQSASFPAHPVESYKYFVGNGITMLVKRALPPHHRDEVTIHKFTASVLDEYSRRWNNKTRPYHGITELLSQLEKLGIKKSVLSNKADEFAKLVTANYFPLFYFTSIFGESTLRPKKPDPSSALETAKKLGLQPQNILFLGDSGVDMKTAQSAGMFGVGALWGFRSKDELLEAGAKDVIGHPRELLKYFAGN